MGQAQGLSPRRHSIRQAGRQLPVRRPDRRNLQLLGQMSPDPSAVIHPAIAIVLDRLICPRFQTGLRRNLSVGRPSSLKIRRTRLWSSLVAVKVRHRRLPQKGDHVRTLSPKAQASVSPLGDRARRGLGRGALRRRNDRLLCRRRRQDTAPYGNDPGGPARRSHPGPACEKTSSRPPSGTKPTPRHGP